MVRTSLLVAITLLLATPLTAQDEITWTPDRPDGHAPLGVTGDRILSPGEFQIAYRYAQMDRKGVWFDNDSLPLATTFEFYEVAPLSQNNVTHTLDVLYGLTDRVTLRASVPYHQFERRSQTDANVLYITEADELGDAEFSGLLEVVRQGGYRVLVEGGVLVPTGQSDVTAVTPFSAPGEEALAYDMRPGGGVFAVLPGATAQVQNEMASLGLQVKGRIHVGGENGSDFVPGDVLEGSLWAAYNVTDAISASARVHYQNWTRVEGADPELDPLRDPTHDGFFAEGSRLSLPIGVNVLMPRGSLLEGHRLSLEYLYPIHQEFEGPQLGFSRGLVVGWELVF